jgi:hypothetical protein
MKNSKIGMKIMDSQIDPITDAALLSDAVRKPIYDLSLELKNSSENELWRKRVIFGIITLAHEHYDCLIDANKRNLPIQTSAYHSRSLLELFVWAGYCLESDDNIKRLHQDALHDGKDLVEMLIKVAENSNKTYEFDSKLANERLNKLAEKEGHPEPTKDFLRLNGLKLDKKTLFYYTSENKFLSKLAHPCGFTIVGMINEETSKMIKSQILKAGCMWYSMIIKGLAVLIDLENT